MKKKKIPALLTIVAAIALLTAGCNRQIVDTKYHFDRAVISLPNGIVVDGKCESWRDYKDGVTYLVHAANVALISGKSE